MSRKIKWVPAINPKSELHLNKLQEKMSVYYTNEHSYYQNIDFSSSSWKLSSELAHIDILEELSKRDSILEIGCGRSSILEALPAIRPCYTGIEFSEQIIEQNKKKYPEANFEKITNPNRTNYPDDHFDAVFSHFVLEHTVFPHLFLSESIRILKPGGILIIICPNFLGRNSMSSQRVGFSQGTGREKLHSGKLIDAIVTGYDSKIRIPLYCWYLKTFKAKNPMFYINLFPTCFTDNFIPDVDAVYLTYENEIKKFLESKVNWQSIPHHIKKYIKNKNLIYLKGVKV